MKKFKFLNTYLNPKQIIRYKDINIIISICIFVISSFLLGAPVGKNKILADDGILEHEDYKVLSEIPNEEPINNVITELINKDCKVIDSSLQCSNYTTEEYYTNTISFVSRGITRNIYIIIDLFDINTVYIDEVDPNFDPRERFTIENYPHAENSVDYLLRFASDTLYFQARPFGINSYDSNLKEEVTEVYYQSLLPEFSIDSENLNVDNFGSYILEQLSIGNENKIKLKSYTLTFLVGVLFTLITIIILWIFFRKNGLIKRFSEYYNIAAITSIPISIIFFILLWFNYNLINIYIFIFSLFYVLVLYKINTSEEII